MRKKLMCIILSIVCFATAMSSCKSEGRDLIDPDTSSFSDEENEIIIAYSSRDFIDMMNILNQKNNPNNKAIVDEISKSSLIPEELRGTSLARVIAENGIENGVENIVLIDDLNISDGNYSGKIHYDADTKKYFIELSNGIFNYSIESVNISRVLPKEIESGAIVDYQYDDRYNKVTISDDNNYCVELEISSNGFSFPNSQGETESSCFLKVTTGGTTSYFQLNNNQLEYFLDKIKNYAINPDNLDLRDFIEENFNLDIVPDANRKLGK